MAGGLKWILPALVLAWVATSFAAKSQTDSKITGSNACISKLKCHECIQTPSCAWCAMPGFEDKRCFLPHINKKTSLQCPANYTFNPDNYFQLVRHKKLTKGNYNQAVEAGEETFSGSEKDLPSDDIPAHPKRNSQKSVDISSNSHSNSKQEAVQLYPQEITLKLRINEVQKIKVEYVQAEDYPVDLYYLMDLSNSMKDDKQKLSDLGQNLVKSMSEITSNFRLGFGSFVDKVVMPYVNMAPNAREKPCHDCAAPYGYRNHMPLSQNTDRFATEVREAPVSGNLDAPEGGFDAIMQAIVCRDEIGWREKARKLLLFSTDASFHYAGDGKLGGIVKPNDGCCHMDKGGMYTHSDVQDYPSISQINLKVKENSVNIIWAVTEEQIKIYSNLTKHIEGSYAAKLSDDSSNIVDLVRDQYNAISSSIEMKDTASNYINLRYFSSCLGNGPMIETNKCDGMKVGKKVEFSVEVEVPACPQNRSEWHQRFLIYPVGINESLTVNLEMLCDCECERGDAAAIASGFEASSKECNAHGDLSCGICDCNEGFFGKQCECSANDRGQADMDELACRRDNTTTGVCSGRGTCECNMCVCNPRDDPNELITGQYCECDNFSCDRSHKELCSGKDNGICVCGNCECKEGWSGSACDCSTKKDMCMLNGVECSGHGVCECGHCKCNIEGENRYTGQYCSVCRSCPSRCDELKPCVLCAAFGPSYSLIHGDSVNSSFGLIDEDGMTLLSSSSSSTGAGFECTANCSLDNLEYEMVDQLEVDVDADEIGCHGYDENDCKYYFAYYHNVTSNHLLVRVQRQRECPPQVYVLGIVLGVIAAVVLIGLALLLLWKLLTTIHDRREFAKFEKERMMAKWDASVNPIYKQATSTFKNPTYNASK
ncbi:hypothetical protein QAD02_000321 [Eretmocerus hayati]|uniref:Uncharacterized protein n=1 Tax=Eretmocerus hayati TaxID=131215 RepID=A0ACC2ND54_9HYME|nr:hypothetical protein QAD02_000321 [Eretmocerus hayati]